MKWYELKQILIHDNLFFFQFFAQFATQNVNGKTSLSLGSPDHSISQLLTGISGISTSHTSSRTSLRTEQDSQGFSASLLYKGYLDDPRNTDNAWMEAEVWNFHYDIGDNFELRMSEVSINKWKYLRWIFFKVYLCKKLSVRYEM